MARFFFLIGALLAALSVAMGAYGAHTNAFDEVQTLWVEKAAHYQMIHALALIITALVVNNKRLFIWQAVGCRLVLFRWHHILFRKPLCDDFFHH